MILQLLLHDCIVYKWIKPNKIKLEITIHKDLLMNPRNICKLRCTWWLCSVQLLLLGVLRWLKTSQENYKFQNISPGSLIPYPSDLYHMRYASLLFASTRKLAKTGSANSSILWTFTCLALFYFYQHFHSNNKIKASSYYNAIDLTDSYTSITSWFKLAWPMQVDGVCYLNLNTCMLYKVIFF